MELCDNKHDEICYYGRVCPVCDLRDDLEQTIAELNQEIDELKDGLEQTIAELNQEIGELKAEL